MAKAKRNFSRLVGAAAIAAGLHATPSLAGPELIKNGNFEATSTASSQQLTNTNVSNWSSAGYNFLYLADASSSSGSTADTTGASGSYGNVKLWGLSTGSANGLSTGPTGGNFIAADNNFEQGAIKQSVDGLTVGQAYTLRFYWAAAQQAGFNGDNQEQWQVTFGSQVQSTELVNLTSRAFSGWKSATMNFVANATTQTLSFLAVGAPNGNPPFSLLDGVSLTAVPEPDTWALMTVGMFGFAGWTIARRQNRT